MKQIRLELYDCGDCPFKEDSFSNSLYYKKAKDCYIHRCYQTKKKLHKDWHIPKWCPLEDYTK